MSLEANEEVRKKPVKGYYVASRYKQAADTFSSQSSQSKERSQDTKCADTLMQSTANLKLSDSSIPKRGNVKKFASTPAIQGHHALPPINASAISDASGFLCNPQKKLPFASATNKGMSKNKTRELSSKHTGPTAATKQLQPKAKSNPLNANEEKEIDLLYVQYLQAKLLESRALKAVQMRSKNALEKMYQAWNLMQALLGKNADVKKDLNFYSYMLTLHGHLRKQEQMLLPALQMIPVLENQYEEIATAVHAIQHKMGVKDIKLPEPGSEEEITLLLKKINVFLNKILECVKNCDVIVSKAEIADNAVKQGKLITEELNRGSQLVSEATNLLISETTLKLAST